jgi:hypothetical protein
VRGAGAAPLWVAFCLEQQGFAVNRTRQETCILGTGPPHIAHAAARTTETDLVALYQRLTALCRNGPSWPWPTRSQYYHSD